MIATTQAVCAADATRLCKKSISAEVEEAQHQHQHQHHHACHMRMLRLGMMLFPGLFFHKHMMWMHEHAMMPEPAQGPVLGFGDDVDRCVLANFRQVSQPCKAAVMEAQTLTWQASDAFASAMDSSRPSMHHGRHHFAMAVVVILLSSVVLMFCSGIRSARAGSWRVRRDQFRRVMQAVRGDAELTSRVESITGEALPLPLGERKSGCFCVRMLSALIFSILLGLAGAAPLLVVWAIAFWLGYILACCFCRCGANQSHSSIPEPTAPQEQPPPYTPRQTTGYVYLEGDAAHPSVVVASHITV
jgi:hypothetical protein